ncbi:MAG: isoprenylcysteine carboxylmethyltransferase family protein [Candidatus Hydrogenedentes bacterium]|nr:isoprenylcysteine carboxylmethyltransferase family protein [Candidatus Hydrogenedentota bacterium]
MKKPLPPTYLLAAILIMVALHFLFPWVKVIPLPWNLLGLLPFLLGGVLNLRADRLFKDRDTTVKPFEESSAFITEGVFGVTRNPMYLGFVLILAGLAAFMGSATPWAIVPAFAVVMEVVFIRPEERAMEAAFGEAYRTYRMRVRRWV